MIISASYRTDIPAFYARWFLGRLDAGFCHVASPYGGPLLTIPLGPDAVDGFVLWTRNLRPLLPDLDRVRARAPFVVQFTVTNYPRALETSVIAPEEAVAQLRELRRRFGPRAAVWRYDPVVLAGGLDAEAHRAHFAALAREMAGLADEVVFSFVHPYRKTRRNLDRAARRGRFQWRDPGLAEKRTLIAALGEIAAEHGFKPTVCSQTELLSPGLAEARCIDDERLSDIAGRPVAAREKGNRPGCRCAQSRDIGAYDSCPHGCAYCYAVSERDRALARFRAHDPDAPCLSGGA